MAGELVVFVTCPVQMARQIATPLVEEGLAACVNVLPAVTSIYRWQGELCQEEEALLVIKSNSRLFGQLEARIKQLHSYEVPEIVGIPIQSGHKPYLDWLNGQLKELPLTTGKESKIG
jgi:periplasmic divalent cation tolerance protein